MGTSSQNGNGNGCKPHFTSTTYPSHCLRFLDKGNGAATIDKNPPQAQLKLDILIVGAGLGGLATAIALARRGHKVTVLEQAPAFGEVGAGIQIPPNSGRLLYRWGVMEDLGSLAVRPDGISVRRWESGKVIGFTDLSSDFSSMYGTPYYVVHRVHFHEALASRAAELGVQIRLNCKVVQYDEPSASVTLQDGTTLCGDLVVAVDGVKSTARALLPAGDSAIPRSTGLSAYRTTVDVAKMKGVPEMAWILENPGLNIWIGEDRHVMTYTIAGGKSFNMVLSHPDKPGPPSPYPQSQEETLRDMQREYEDWDPQLVKVIGLADRALRWPLMVSPPLRTWVGQNSRLVILGDAAHAMAPYMSQGAAMAVEDGAALAVAINDLRTAKDLAFALRVFEKERIRRSSMMQEASMVNAMIWHFEDGPLQESRDAAMRAEVERRPFLSSPNQWSDPQTQMWAYGYDAEKVMEARWEKAVKKRDGVASF
ncbi:hypothetical protein RB596_005523 [Gaeumannomyces avenae]